MMHSESACLDLQQCLIKHDQVLKCRLVQTNIRWPTPRINTEYFNVIKLLEASISHVPPLRNVISAVLCIFYLEHFSKLHIFDINY